MSTVTVLRIELDNGEGPYQHEVESAYGWNVWEGTWWPPDYRHHPTPANDGIEGYGRYSLSEYDKPQWWEEWQCGFATREQLHDWFAGIEESLDAHGFHLSIYEVPEEDVKLGDRQVIFHKRGRQPVRTLSVTEAMRNAEVLL